MKLFRARVEKNGRVLLPAVVRRQLRVKPGDELLLRMEEGEGGVHLTTVGAAIRKVQEELRKYVPEGGTILSDDIIAMRRVEAVREADLETSSE